MYGQRAGSDDGQVGCDVLVDVAVMEVRDVGGRAEVILTVVVTVDVKVVKLSETSSTSVVKTVVPVLTVVVTVVKMVDTEPAKTVDVVTKK
jgi:hypothetical protein